jgi:hypothetical protein
MVVHSYNSSTLEAKARGFQFHGQPRQDAVSREKEKLQKEIGITNIVAQSHVMLQANRIL